MKITITITTTITRTITRTITMFRGLSEEFGLVKEAEQQLLLYNIFISHQLAAFQVGLFSLSGTGPGDYV